MEDDSVAILCKGKSLEKIQEHHNKFNNCLIVNNFQLELLKFSRLLKNKNIVHFTNKMNKQIMPNSFYKEFNINDILLMKPWIINDFQLNFIFLKHLFNGRRVKFCKKSLLQKYYINKNFKNKFPNTGIMAIIYAIEVLKPKTIYIFGLDFYEQDYLYRRKNAVSSLDDQRRKIVNLDLTKFCNSLFEKNSCICFKIATYSTEIKKLNNVKIL